MEKLVAYKMTVSEAEDKLQCLSILESRVVEVLK